MKSEAISYVLNWAGWIAKLIAAGSGTMLTYLFFKKSCAIDEGEISECNRKIKNTLKGAIIGITITGFIEVIQKIF